MMNLKENEIMCCPKCGAKSFCATAHVTQDWVVDEKGNFIKSHNDCLEVTHFPDENDIFDCNNCGYSAEGREFITIITTQEKGWK